MSNLTSGFIDLATFDDIEAMLYGGDKAVTYFIRQTKKSSWFTQVPVVLSNVNGTADFGQNWSVSISRAGDYLLHAWLQVTTPAITPTSGFHNFWTKNFMHNLVEECSITFNDLVAHKFDSVQLDFWSAFMVPAGKKSGYDAMIGAGVKTLHPNGSDRIFLHGVDASKSHTFQLPLPFFFTRESGVALPTAAIPYNDMRINFKFRSLSQLLTAYDGNTSQQVLASPATYSSSSMSLSGSQVFANYAIVSNEERQLMGSTPRDIIIEQNQSAPVSTLKEKVNTSSYDIRFSHSVKSLFFALRQKDLVSGTYMSGPGFEKGAGGDVLSNYAKRSDAGELTGDYTRVSPLEKVSLLYENTVRLGDMPSSYFTKVAPYYHAESIPEEAGMHMYSYSLDARSIDPMGSTNYGKLTHVSLTTLPSTGGLTGNWDVVVTAVNHNIIRVSGGAVGFPIL